MLICLTVRAADRQSALLSLLFEVDAAIDRSPAPCEPDSESPAPALPSSAHLSVEQLSNDFAAHHHGGFRP